MPELKPCPFCGKDAQIAPDEIGGGGQHVPPYHAGCLRGAGCGIAFTADDPDEAVAEWNRRALSTVTPDEAGGLVERLQEQATLMKVLSPYFASACREAASLIQSQAARISALEAGLGEFADPANWVVDGRFDPHSGNFDATTFARSLLNGERKG